MKKNLAVHFKSGDTDWETPKELFAALNSEFHFTLDPCANSKNKKCETYYNRRQNGLIQPWSDEVVFMNPPYGSEISKWVQKAAEEAYHANATVVCLLPARTDTAWWHDTVIPLASEVRFLRGRIKFVGAKNSAPFPSAIVIFSRPKLPK